MSMIRFTCTEKLLKFTDYTGESERVIVMHEGDSATLPEPVVRDLCANGWGTADGIETAERKPGRVILAPENTLSRPKPAQAAPQAAG